MTNSGGPGSFFNSSDIGVVRTDLILPVGMSHSALLIFASIFALISLADLLLNLLRQNSRTEDDFESLAVMGMPTLPYHGHRSKIMDDDHADLLFTGAHTDASMDIRRRIRLRQKVQDEITIENGSVRQESPLYSITRYLNKPPEHETIGEPGFFHGRHPYNTLEGLSWFGFGIAITCLTHTKLR